MEIIKANRENEYKFLSEMKQRAGAITFIFLS